MRGARPGRRRRRLAGALVAALALLFPACERRSGAGVQFVDRAAESGIDFRHTDGSSGGYFITETLASGLALFDYDSDGDLDLYLVNGRPLPPGAPPAERARGATEGNALYRNDLLPGGALRFTDVTRQAGVPGTGFGVAACAGDPDGDGDLDLFVAQLGPDVLYRNNGDGTFTDVTKEAGVGDPAFGGGAAFGDINKDGWLDLYVSNYCVEDFGSSRPCLTNGIPHYCAPATFQEVPHSLFLNLGNGAFRDVSETSGIRKPHPGQGLGVRFCDFDDDGYPEIFVANDGSENFLFHNQRDGTFKNIGLEAGVALDKHGDELGNMGVDIADYDGDGRLDIVVTTFQKQATALFRNEGNLSFRDAIDASGMAASSLPMVGWGTRFFDYDHDGILDVFIANGHLEDRIHEYDQSSTYLQPNQLFRGMGVGKFREVTQETGPGLQVRRSSRGAAFGDIDNDGDIDVAVLCSRDRPLLLLNEGGNRRAWIQFELRGKKPNVFAVGARLTLKAGGRTYLDEVRSGGSYASQNDLRLHFGLGEAAVERVEVRWPDGTVEEVRGARPGRLNRIVQGAGAVEDGPARPKA